MTSSIPVATVQDLRKRFLERLKKEYNNSTSLFHPSDVERVRNNDNWLARFLNHQDGDVTEALNMLWDTCEWRKSMKVNEVNEQNVCLEYLKDGSLFPYGCDKDDKLMLVFKCKCHVKGQKSFEELKRCLIYWFERLERETNGDQITIFFDMMETGLSNMDMEFTKYLISLNKLYYPSFLNYILIYEMPWVLNAAFKIIKSWLPARAVQKIKFLNKSSIKEYVKPDRMLVSWGGDDDYNFCFVPEVRTDLATSTKTEETKKKTVHFALNKSSTKGLEMKSDNQSLSNKDTPSLIKVTPGDTVIFDWNGTDCVGSIIVENISDKSILYKIKTTSPDRFHVRPSSGILKQGQTAKTTVVLQSRYNVQSVLSDKFLIVAMVSYREEATPQEVVDLWKNSEKAKIEQHRLRCSFVEPTESNVSMIQSNEEMTLLSAVEDLHNKVEQLKNVVYEMCAGNTKLRKDLSYRQNVITVILIILVVCVLSLLFFAFGNPSIGFAKTSTHSSLNNSHTGHEHSL